MNFSRHAAMAQPDPNRKFSEVSPNSSKAPRSQNSPTFQQLIQGEASLWSPNSSPKLRKNVEHEEDHHNRKSVLAKVKERAKKLRNSLSGKRLHQDHHLYSGSNSTPSWGVSLEDYEDDEEDPEYLGAPMYESELAPETYKQTAREHPREVHGVPSEKHVISSCSLKQGKEDHQIPTKTITETVSKKLEPTYTAVSETVSEKHGAVPDATQNVASKFANLTVSTSQGTETGAGKIGSGINDSGESTRSPQTWDKGVSVKEYLMQKLEPGEDERALSQVISENLSPRRTLGDSGMVEKMKGAVSSFLWTEEPSQTRAHSAILADIPISYNTSPSSPKLVSTAKTSPSSHSYPSPTSAPTTKTSSLSHSYASPTSAPATKTSSLSHSYASPTSAPATKTSSLSHSYASPTSAPTTKTSSSPHTSLSHTNASTTKTSSSSHTSSLSHTNASTAKTSSSPHTSSLSPTNASTAKTSSSPHTSSLSPTNASTTKTSLSAHTPSTTNAARHPTSKRSMSTRAPVTTTVSTTRTSSLAHTPVSTTNANSSTHQIPISTYVGEVLDENNHGRVLQAN